MSDNAERAKCFLFYYDSMTKAPTNCETFSPGKVRKALLRSLLPQHKTANFYGTLERVIFLVRLMQDFLCNSSSLLPCRKPNENLWIQRSVHFEPSTSNSGLELSTARLCSPCDIYVSLIIIALIPPREVT